MLRNLKKVENNATFKYNHNAGGVTTNTFDMLKEILIISTETIAYFNSMGTQNKFEY